MTQREEFEAWTRKFRNWTPELTKDAWETWQAAQAVMLKAEPVGSVYKMEALTPGGGIRHHASLTKELPAGTVLYAAQAAQPARPKTASRLTDKEYSDPEYMRGYVESLNEIADSFAARLAQPAQPEGWKLVPVEPTQAMIAAGEAADDDSIIEHPFYVATKIYKAMLSAAPSTKERA